MAGGHSTIATYQSISHPSGTTRGNAYHFEQRHFRKRQAVLSWKTSVFVRLPVHTPKNTFNLPYIHIYVCNLVSQNTGNSKEVGWAVFTAYVHSLHRGHSHFFGHPSYEMSNDWCNNITISAKETRVMGTSISFSAFVHPPFYSDYVQGYTSNPHRHGQKPRCNGQS